MKRESLGLYKNKTKGKKMTRILLLAQASGRANFAQVIGGANLNVRLLKQFNTDASSKMILLEQMNRTHQMLKQMEWFCSPMRML